MEHITLINIIFLFIGILLHVLIDYTKSAKIKKQFTFDKWFRENKITIIISFLVGFISLYFVDLAMVWVLQLRGMHFSMRHMHL